jgi:hypothetical protein
MGGPQSGSGRFGVEINLLLLPVMQFPLLSSSLPSAALEVLWPSDEEEHGVVRVAAAYGTIVGRQLCYRSQTTEEQSDILISVTYYIHYILYNILYNIYYIQSVPVGVCNTSREHSLD